MNILNWILLFSLAVTLFIIFKMKRSASNAYYETGFLHQHHLIVIEIESVKYRVSYFIPMKIEREFGGDKQYALIYSLMLKDRTGATGPFLSGLAAYQIIEHDISIFDGQPR